MRLISQSELAMKTGVPQPTINRMIHRGVLPDMDIKCGRVGYYSAELAAIILNFLLNEYQPCTRYPAGFVSVEK